MSGNGFPGTAFIIFPSGAFGGAEKRFTNLFRHLRITYPGTVHFIINPLMKAHISRIYPGFDFSNVHVINTGSSTESAGNPGNRPKKYFDNYPDPETADKDISYTRKYYRYYKNKLKQKELYRQIETIRLNNNISVLIGIFAGGLPLVFYKEKNIRGVKIIFSDMDSWFTDILSDTKKFWYRRYYSFNNIIQLADKVDFLSPYIAQGIKQRGITLSDEKISVAPCSFIDFGKCIIGKKENLEIAFASRLEPDKNPMLYLEAAKEILEKYPGVKFHLLGEGSLVDEINDFIIQNGLKDKINFTFHNNPPEIFSHTSVFVSLQSGTNYPSQSVLEAMACGNAVLASDTGDTHLFVNETNGMLVPLDKKIIISSLISMIEDKQKTNMLGLAAVKFVKENHTIERVSQYYKELITGVKDEGYIG